jgi:uncharacterized protein with gpF-like domain
MIHIPDDKDRRKAGRRKEKLGGIVKSPKSSEMDLRRMMGELWQRVLEPTTQRVKELIDRGAPLSEIALELENALHRANTEYAKVSEGIVGRWLLGVSKETRRRMEAAMRNSLGVDTAFIIDQEPVRTALLLSGVEAADLIKTIPSECLGRVARAVADNFAGRPLAQGSLTKELVHIGGITQRRAKLIARDQTSKLTGTLNQVRQESIGITEYIWRTVQDARVAGDPSGKYPDADKDSKFHGDHYHRNGKRFRWDTPPPDGHPGQPGFCRCHAQPVIDAAKIVARAEGRTT